MLLAAAALHLASALRNADEDVERELGGDVDVEDLEDAEEDE
jgi:hypothetical protein